MVDHNFQSRGSMNVGLADSMGMVNFHSLCERLSNLDSRIAGALVIRKGKLLAASNRAGLTFQSDEYLAKLIRQVEIMVGIPLANKPYFPYFNFSLIGYDWLDSMLFYLQTENAILGVGLLPPYDLSVLSRKIRELLVNSRWL